MPDTPQRIGPVLVYDNAEAAIAFLTKAFGFTEQSGDEAARLR